MSILADLVVADDEKAERYHRLPSRDQAAALGIQAEQHGGLTPLVFELLWAQLESVDWSPDVHVLDEIEMGENGGSWLFRFPQPLVSALARLTDEETAAIAPKWSALEELSCEASDVVPVLRSLRQLARLAEERGESLFLHGSL